MSTKYAIIRIKDKQFFVREGTKVKVVELRDTDNVDVLLLKENDFLEIGEPLVNKGGVVLERLGDKKIKTEVRRYKSKSRYRKNKSHSQKFSFLRVINISSGLKKSSIKEEKAITKKASKKNIVKTAKKAKKTVTRTTASKKVKVKKS